MVKFELTLPIEKKAILMQILESRKLEITEYKSSIFNSMFLPFGRLLFIETENAGIYKMIGGALYNRYWAKDSWSLPVLRIEQLPDSIILRFYYPLSRYWVLAVFLLIGLIITSINLKLTEDHINQNYLALKLNTAIIGFAIVFVLFDVFCLYGAKQSIKAYLEDRGA